jgi:hypothetical protein
VPAYEKGIISAPKKHLEISQISCREHIKSEEHDMRIFHRLARPRWREQSNKNIYAT